jgi:cytochrome c-type biogenesis protein CcmH
MSRNGFIAVSIVVLVLGSVFAADLERQAKKIEGMLMAPCCGANPVAQHYSPGAEQMRVEIRQMLSEGRSQQEILDFYVARHGEQILAAPPARGFNLVAYLLPGAGLLTLAVVLLLWMRRVAGRSVAEAPRADYPEPDPRYVERLERQMRAMR